MPHVCAGPFLLFPLPLLPHRNKSSSSPSHLNLDHHQPGGNGDEDLRSTSNRFPRVSASPCDTDHCLILRFANQLPSNPSFFFDRSLPWGRPRVYDSFVVEANCLIFLSLYHQKKHVCFSLLRVVPSLLVT